MGRQDKILSNQHWRKGLLQKQYKTTKKASLGKGSMAKSMKLSLKAILSIVTLDESFQPQPSQAATIAKRDKNLIEKAKGKEGRDL